MSGLIIQFDYEQLPVLAQTFAQQAQELDDLRLQLVQQLDVLQSGGWLGVAADRFYDQMLSDVLPNYNRLIESMNCTHDSLQQTIAFAHETEVRLAQRWRQLLGEVELVGGKSGALSASVLDDIGRWIGDTADKIQQTFTKFADWVYPAGKYARLYEMKPFPDGTLFAQGVGDSGDIYPDDVKQGMMGDCYVLSSLAAVAQQQPELIRGMIHDNGDGTYTAQLYDGAGGSRQSYVLDNQLPVTISQNSSIHAQFGDTASDGKKEMWVPLLEKAVADHKSGGGGFDVKDYVNIGEGGYPKDVLPMLTGNPNSYAGSAGGIKFEDLASKFKNSEAIVVGTLAGNNPNLSKLPLYQSGQLVASHAYYVVGVDEVNKTVTIRNPWGWDNTDPRMTAITIPYDEMDDYFGSLAANPTRRISSGESK
ncbi:MAG: C2 family cysteine protease [Anaerolineae bacterium]